MCWSWSIQSQHKTLESLHTITWLDHLVLCFILKFFLIYKSRTDVSSSSQVRQGSAKTGSDLSSVTQRRTHTDQEQLSSCYPPCGPLQPLLTLMFRSNHQSVFMSFCRTFSGFIFNTCLVCSLFAEHIIIHVYNIVWWWETAIWAVKICFCHQSCLTGL